MFILYYVFAQVNLRHCRQTAVPSLISNDQPCLYQSGFFISSLQLLRRVKDAAPYGGVRHAGNMRRSCRMRFPKRAVCRALRRFLYYTSFFLTLYQLIEGTVNRAFKGETEEAKVLLPLIEYLSYMRIFLFYPMFELQEPPESIAEYVERTKQLLMGVYALVEIVGRLRDNVGACGNRE